MCLPYVKIGMQHTVLCDEAKVVLGDPRIPMFIESPMRFIPAKSLAVGIFYAL